MVSGLTIFHVVVFLMVSARPISFAVTKIRVSILTIFNFVVFLTVSARSISFALTKIRVWE